MAPRTQVQARGRRQANHAARAKIQMPDVGARNHSECGLDTTFLGKVLIRWTCKLSSPLVEGIWHGHRNKKTLPDSTQHSDTKQSKESCPNHHSSVRHWPPARMGMHKMQIVQINDSNFHKSRRIRYTHAFSGLTTCKNQSCLK